MRRAAGAAAVLAAALLAAPRRAAGEGGAAGLVEKEFSAAIQRITPATVYCLAKAGQGPSPGSSGVIITRSGYLLSDGDAGAYFKPVLGPDGKPRGGEKVMSPVVEVRFPDLKHGTYQVYTAKVVKRVEGIDSTLLKIDNPPSSGFPFVPPSTSAGLEVGQFTFAMGMSFGNTENGQAALTGGVVAALVPAPADDPGGRWSEVYTSAAVNPGVNGGPLVDVEGGLVGIISTWGQPEPKNPYQFLGKAYPIDRIRAAYKDLPDAAAIFPEAKSTGVRSKQADLLEKAFAATARKVYPSVVSLEIERGEPFEKMSVPGPGGRPAELPRYAGPVSGILVSRDGWIVSSLYAFANTTSLAYFGFPTDIVGMMEKVKAVKADFADGTSLPAKVVAHDQRVGIVLLKAEMDAAHPQTPVEPAPPEELQQGRIVLCVANPFGAARYPSPMLTVGMLSRVHPEDDEKAWRGDFQTDAGMTDGTVGGALVDLHGRLLGLATLWDPAGQGRNSGIGYGIPWARIKAALPPLEAGTSYRYGDGWMGIGWQASDDGVKIVAVAPEGPAGKAGIQAGDVVVAIDGKPVPKLLDAQEVVRTHFAGDKIKMTVARGATRTDIEFELAKRPGW